MAGTQTSVQMVTPLPPLASGIAQYSRDLLNAVDGYWRVRVLAEEGSTFMDGATVDVGRRFDPDLPSIYQIGNSEFHGRAFRFAREAPGVLVLHDVVLHHARLASAVRRGRGNHYTKVMRRLYGAEGEGLAREILRGKMPPDLLAYPLSEDYVQRARVTVVHNHFACERVAERNPEAEVLRVPMGVPLPALVDQTAARRALGLPESAYIVASITHVNPLKRLPEVLRSLRRVVQRVPETLLVIAGTEAPGVNLERQIAMLGLESHVHRIGYVPDGTARLLARASDVCVNLRYPATGETSASLLRLLGAGRPVLVTDGIASSELSLDAGIRVPVDRFEEEYIAELLVELASNERFREMAGREARAFVEREHTMKAAVDGYREAVRRAFGIDLPSIGEREVHEPEPDLPDRPRGGRPSIGSSPFDRTVAAAVDGLHLGSHDGTIHSVSERMVELGVDTMVRQRDPSKRNSEDNGPIRKELLDILACPVCKTAVRLEGDELVCDTCSRRYRIENGVPIMLPDDGK